LKSSEDIKQRLGLSLQEHNVAIFTEQLQIGYEKAGYVQEGFDPTIIGELHFHDISFELTGLIKEFEPYGQANPTPKFISKKVEILQVQSMGKEGEHLRFSFAQEGIVMPGVQFKTRQTYELGSKVDIIYMVNENHFRGNVTLQLMIEKILG